MKLINQINNFFRKNKKDNSQLLSEITEPNQWEYHFNPQKSKYHNYEESYFKQESTGKILRFTSSDVLDILVFYIDYRWDAQKLFNEFKFGDEIYEDSFTVDDIQLFLDEYEKGNFDQAITFICDNEIEYHKGFNKNDYLSEKNKKIKKPHINEFNHDFYLNNKKVKINEDYLKKHYHEMMDVDDVPLPLGILDLIVPEMQNYMIEKVKEGDRSSVYVKYNDGFFSQSGEDFLDESLRLLELYLEKHPEHSELILEIDS